MQQVQREDWDHTAELHSLLGRVLRGPRSYNYLFNIADPGSGQHLDSCDSKRGPRPCPVVSNPNRPSGATLLLITCPTPRIPGLVNVWTVMTVSVVRGPCPVVSSSNRPPKHHYHLQPHPSLPSKNRQRCRDKVVITVVSAAAVPSSFALVVTSVSVFLSFSSPRADLHDQSVSRRGSMAGGGNGLLGTLALSGLTIDTVVSVGVVIGVKSIIEFHRSDSAGPQSSRG